MIARLFPLLTIRPTRVTNLASNATTCSIDAEPMKRSSTRAPTVDSVVTPDTGVVVNGVVVNGVVVNGVVVNGVVVNGVVVVVVVDGVRNLVSNDNFVRGLIVGPRLD